VSVSGAVRVAVVDSGVNVPHPHLPAVAGGLGIDAEGNVSEGYVDRLGHGTAVAAAIYEKAPGVELWVVKVFDRELATSVPTLVRAMDWASETGCRLINMSLGTSNGFRRTELAPAMERAVACGALVVSAFEFQEARWYPGSMPGAVGVVMDPAHPRDSVSVVEIEGRPVLSASPHPRPIPGVPPERNLNGISFAVANATGVLANILADELRVRTATDALRVVAERGGRAKSALV
jgi:subtilisin family serine protease